MDKLVIKNSDYSEPLNSVLPDSFQIQLTLNQNWQLQFTALDDGSVPYSLLQPENSVLWQGQEFVIKQCQPQYSQGINTNQVTATHIGYDVQRVFQHNTNAGVKTYSVNDVLSFYLNGNNFGYTWKVIGNFDNQQIENLGNSNGQDMLSKITSTWDNAIYYPDNKCIQIFSADEFRKYTQKVVTYKGNSDTIQLSYDATNLVNKLYCVSDNGDDNKPAFQPFYVQDDESIKKYGVYEGSPVSDNRFNNADAMRQYAQSQLQPNPDLSIQVSFYAGEDDVQLGEVRRLIIPEDDISLDVEVSQITLYPISQTQQSQAQLNSTAKTILNYYQSLKNGLSSRVSNDNGINQSIANAIQQNQDAINRINDSLKQQTESVSNDCGTVNFTLNNGVVYVNCNFTNVVANKSSWSVPKDYIPKNEIQGTLVINLSGSNYLINYTLNSQLSIGEITNLQGQETAEITNQCTGNFNYLV